MERTAKKRVRKGITRSNGAGKKGQNKAKIARSSSLNIAMSPEATVKVEPTENARILNEIVPDEDSLIIKLERDPEFPVTDDCLNLSQLQLLVRDIDEMPPGVELETPLHPKRRRMWQPPSSPQPSTSKPATSLVEPPVASTSSFPSISPLPHSPAPNFPEVSVPSPAAFIECSSGRSDRAHLPPRRPLCDDETMDPLFYGSELESEEEDDDVLPVFVPRTYRIFEETPIDEPVEMDTQPEAEFNSPPTADTELPRGLFEFTWTNFPEPPINPSLRREQFSQNNVGPTTPEVDPYEIFMSIWDRKFVEYIAAETNKYAQQRADAMIRLGVLGPRSRITDWRDTDADEIYVYIAVILAMGVVIRTKMEEYWCTKKNIFITPGFSASMSYNRFTLLSTCLHFRDNSDMGENLSFEEAKLFKISPVLSHLNEKFQKLYNPGQNLALDESLLQWKGWLEINQMIPNKAAKVGIKTYEICESQTGYLWRFEVHTGRKSPQQQDDYLEAAIPALVIRLTKGLEYKGHTLWMDNYYNSPALARHLKSVGFDCVGTLRTNRQLVPQDLQQMSKQNMRPGQITGVTSGDVDVMVWKDVNRVAMISTYHGNAVRSSKPILILDYTITMGGVDKKDQMLAMYPIERKRTRVWYKKLFRRLLNVSVLNSYLIHKHNATDHRLSHREFRYSLVESILEKHQLRTPPVRLPVAPPVVAPENDVPCDITHRLSEYPMGHHQRQRKRCMVCKKRIHTFCVGCNKPMCLGLCFATAHET